MSDTVLEAPKSTPKIAGVGSTGDAFTDRVKELMEAGNATPEVKEPKKETPKEVVKETEAKTPEKTEAKPNGLLDGFDRSTKKPEAKETPTETPKDAPKEGDKETNLANLRKQMEAAQAERDAIKAKLKELEGKPNVPEDYAQLKADYEMVNGELKKVKLEATPEFQRKYNVRLDKTATEIGKILGNTEINPTEFLDLVKAPESKERNARIAEALEGLDKFNESKLSNAITEFDRIRDERNAELSNPDEQLLKLTEAEKQAQARQKEEANGLIHSVIQEVESAPDFAWLKENPELSPEWNNALRQVKQNAVDGWVKPTPLKQQAQSALAAAMAPLLYTLLQNSRVEAQAEITKLNDELAKYRKSTPATSGGRSEKSTPSPAETKAKGKDAFMDAFKASLNG